jgi:hypothetical protein
VSLGSGLPIIALSSNRRPSKRKAAASRCVVAEVMIEWRVLGREQRVLSSNARAIACYRKCGFVEEGREREAAFAGSTWQDDVMGLLDREFSPH